MKSPCLDYKGGGLPCRYAHLDKNNAICEECNDRLMYIDSIGKCPGSSMSMEVVKGEEREIRKEEKIMDKEKMKVCKHKDCPFNGEPQPLDDFDNSNNSKDGKSSNCKECRRRMQTKCRKSRKIKKGGRKQPAIKTEKVHPLEPRLDPPDIPEYKTEGCLIIDFSKHEHILSHIERIAGHELRSPEMQVLYWLKEFSLLSKKELSDET